MKTIKATHTVNKHLLKDAMTRKKILREIAESLSIDMLDMEIPTITRTELITYNCEDPDGVRIEMQVHTLTNDELVSLLLSIGMIRGHLPDEQMHNIYEIERLLRNA